MRIGPPALPFPCTRNLASAQMVQTVCQAGGHRSAPTDSAVEPASRITPDLRVRPASQHTYDIRV